MIRVIRPAAVPMRLETRGVADVADICALFDAQAAMYSAGPKTLPFKTEIYGHPSVKQILQRAQHDKCCYCEGIFHSHAAGDVEHFRPKACWQQDAASPRSYPGYYWLAYHWQNLLFSCQVCNRSHKRNFFPISNQSRRARKRSDPIARERPLLIDPSGPDDPRDLIRFHEEVPRGLTRRGRITIEVLRLDRPALNDQRREKLDRIKALQAIVTVFASDATPKNAAMVEQARQDLVKAQSASAAFSSMVQDFLKG